MKTTHPLNHIRAARPKATKVFDSFWSFAVERQKVFFRRYEGAAPPWTSDPILLEHKFTNAYRASDRVSQFLINDVIYAGDQSPDELFFRTILFKLFNKIDTWLLLRERVGEVSYASFSYKRYDRVLTDALERGAKIYSAAYIMPSGSRLYGTNRKHRAHLQLLASMMKDAAWARIADSKSMADAFTVLRSYPMIGDFLAYQYITDLNYSSLTNFSEMDFVIPGPGAKDGLRKCFSSLGDFSESDAIRFVAESQTDEFKRRNLHFRDLWGRPLQLIDCQNLFCETDKYARVAHPEVAGLTNRTKIKQKYRVTLKPLQYRFPPKWNINDRILKSPGMPHGTLL